MSPLILFILKAGLIYGVWQLTYDYVLLPDGRLDTFLSLSGVNAAGSLLSFLGWDIEVTGRVITCIGQKGVEIQNGCNGLNLLGLYGGFIIAYPGPWQKRLIVLISGILLLFLANCVRIAFFAVFNASLPQYFHIAHDLSSYIFFYPIVLSMWYLWIQTNEKETLLNYI